MIQRMFYSLLFFMYAFYGQAQEVVESKQRGLNAKFITTEINIDGEISSEEWKNIEVTTNFNQKWPTDTALAQSQTEVSICYDEKYIYLAVKCYDKAPQILQTLKRDKGFWESDAFAVYFDPQNQQNNGYFFGITSYANQTEGLIGTTGLDESWDCKWYSSSKRYSTYWTAEIAIPLNVLRFPLTDTWGINFLHCDMHRNMYSVWSKIPRELSIHDLGYNGILKFENKLPKSRQSFSVNPYIKAQYVDDKEADPVPTKEFTPDFGIDARMAVTSTTNLDVTYRPDFSQVEVDQQQINLTQFQIFFPEKRGFFLENSDIFSQFGAWNVRPFNSRAIGMRDGEVTPIQYGIRYTGNINSKIRFGILDVQTQKTENTNGENFSMLALQHRFWKRSSVSFMMSNVQETEKGEGLIPVYGRNIGLECKLNSKDNAWRSNYHVHLSKTNESVQDNHFYSVFLEHIGKRFGGAFELNSLGSDFSTKMGISRLQWHYNAETEEWNNHGYNKNWNRFYYYFFGKSSSKIAVHYPIVENEISYYDDNKEGFRYHKLKWAVEFKNRAYFETGVQNDYNRLLYPINLTGGENLPAKGYTSNSGYVMYATDDRKKVKSFSFFETGSFYGGYKNTFKQEIKLRFQPFLNIGGEVQYNLIYLPEPYNSGELLLISTNIEFSFNKNIFWSNYIQYNTQIDNINLNSRFRWRFTPMSDIFFIVSNNYWNNTFAPKNNNLVLKINYWLTF